MCMGYQFNRDRKDDGVKKRKEHMVPTYAIFEDQPVVKKTTVSYASDEEDYGSFAPQEETKSDYRSLASAKPLIRSIIEDELDASRVWRDTQVCRTTSNRRLSGGRKVVPTRNTTKEVR
ncbi:hypothetical protein U9M48_031756 [Paspalum notatum var. saurae]|uniref:Uncharacterized protein n=1 Tax=Paspalum notatum var. saurae TaxID=547442 RepID=A0AAQ3U3Q6_PASNO